ncbi:MAG: hypothetical protein ACI9MR_002265 [Myxococcota bacterium]|jgi:hypothetical protein
MAQRRRGYPCPAAQFRPLPLRYTLHLLEPHVDFTDAPPSLDAVRAYVAASRASARIRPALLSNPMAATNWRSVAHLRLVKQMPDATACLQTPSIEALPSALRYLLFDRQANVLVINGGDGTIHHALNAAIACIEEASDILGRPVPLPRFLFVNGGGMNMLARNFESRGHPVRTLRKFFKQARGAMLGTLATRAIPLLAVTEPEGSVRYGYIFGSELVYNALTMYERFGQGYGALTRFLWEVASGLAFKTELWHRFGHLLDAPVTPLHIDGVTHPRYCALVATTVPLQLAKGVVAPIRRTADPGAFNAIAILATERAAVIGTIPALMVGRKAPGVAYLRDVIEATLHGRYTVDGELVHRVDGNLEAPLRVRGSQHVVEGIWLA